MDGALMLNIKSGWLFDNIKMINDIGGKVNGEIYILDDRGNFIDHDKKDSSTSNEAFRTDLLKNFKTELNNKISRSYFFSTINDSNYLITYQKIKDINWVLLNIQDFNEAYRDVHELRSSIFIIALIFMIIAIVIAATISERIYRPVGKLIRQYGFHDPDRTASTGNKDEFTFLNHVYSDFNQQLEQYKPIALEKSIKNPDFTYSSDIEKKFTDEIKAGNTKAAVEHLNEILNEIALLNYNNIILSLIKMTNSIHKTIEELNHSRLIPVLIDTKALTGNIVETGTIDNFRENMIDILHAVNAQAKNKENEKHRMLVDTIREIIQSNYYDTGLCAQQIASMLKMSSYHVRDIFRSHTDMSVSEYINEVRLNKAIEWFNNSNASIGEIMRKVGMENESYFYKLFKKKYGTTPKQYILNKTIREL